MGAFTEVGTSTVTSTAVSPKKTRAGLRCSRATSVSDVCDYAPVRFEEIADYMAPRIEVFETDKAAFIAGDVSKTIE